MLTISQLSWQRGIWIVSGDLEGLVYGTDGPWNDLWAPPELVLGSTWGCGGRWRMGAWSARLRVKPAVGRQPTVNPPALLHGHVLWWSGRPMSCVDRELCTILQRCMHVLSR